MCKKRKKNQNSDGCEEKKTASPAEMDIGKYDPDSCRVGPSPLHGNGVFANRDIAQGEIVTLYPEDYLLQHNDCSSGARVDIHVKQLNSNANRDLKINTLEDYAIDISVLSTVVDGVVFKLSGDPALTTRGWLGHLVNDCAALENSTSADLCTYLSKSTTDYNCVFHHFIKLGKPHVAVVSIRPITIGKEVLVSYGSVHWETKAGTGRTIQAELNTLSQRVGIAAARRRVKLINTHIDKVLSLKNEDATFAAGVLKNFTDQQMREAEQRRVKLINTQIDKVRSLKNEDATFAAGVLKNVTDQQILEKKNPQDAPPPPPKKKDGKPND